MEKLEKLLEWGGIKKDITFLVLSGIALLFSMIGAEESMINFAWIAVVLCGVPIILEAMIGLVTEFDIKADVLVSIALLSSLFIGEYFAAGEIAFIMQLGALLEDITVEKARSGIEKLVKATPNTARILNDQEERMIQTEEVKIGDILRVLPGESIPVDGVILTGQTSINQASLTGESLPVDKSTGDEVFSGTVNLFGAFEMRAAKVNEDSTIQRMIQLVQSADAGKAKVVGLADRWATWIVVIALVSAVLTGFLSKDIYRAVTILVVFCPCALVLATPTAIMAAIGKATRHGILVREGDALERMAEVTDIAFDKTGTLTHGKLEVKAVHSFLEGLPEEELYKLAASAEQLSEHPLGRAVVHCFQRENKNKMRQPEKFEMIPGRGIIAVVDEKHIIAGNRRILQDYGILIKEREEQTIAAYLKDGNTLIYFGINGTFAGILVLADRMRENVDLVIQEIKKNGVDSILLTGDQKGTAEFVGKKAGVTRICAQCLPEEKLSWIEKFQKQQKKICMIGDGINDAPALKKAHVGIAMGDIGSDIAVEAADIVLVNDDIQELPFLINLSQRMMKTIKFNIIFSLGLNTIAILLAITGILNPIMGALVHNSGSILVVIHSAFLLRETGK